jgi:hypothetical protein
VGDAGPQEVSDAKKPAVAEVVEIHARHSEGLSALDQAHELSRFARFRKTNEQPITPPASGPCEAYRRYMGKQVFVELLNGSRYTGTVLRIGGDFIELDTGIILVRAIAVLSDKLLPSYVRIGR